MYLLIWLENYYSIETEGVFSLKVGILTWYKAINHGAVLQTYASSEILKSMGVTPIVLDYKWSINDEEDKMARLLRRLKKLTPMKVIWYLRVKKLFEKKSVNFQSFIRCRLNVGEDYSLEKNLDAVYIGSDMVFDITEGYNPYMYGEGVNSPYIFSYAASFGYTSLELLKKSGHYNDIKYNLSNLKYIGYRDEKTRDLCNEMHIQVPMMETIDPVLCYGFEYEISTWDTGKWSKQNYLLIYAYDSTMNDRETVKAIKSFAKDNNLKIISCGYYHGWCDECIPAAPDEFIEMFKHASFIITDTFHGTVFSLIMHKKFTSIIRENGFKIRHLLTSIGMQNRISSEPNNIATILLKELDYSTYEKWVEESRTISRDFIQKNLQRAGEVLR